MIASNFLAVIKEGHVAFNYLAQLPVKIEQEA
jgi:hypothetical protein